MGPDGGCAGDYCPMVDAITLIDGTHGLNGSHKCVQQSNGSINRQELANSMNGKSKRQLNGQNGRQIYISDRKEEPPLYLEILCYISYA
ncbi:unnamed protein product, partial [Oppiella nova]